MKRLAPLVEADTYPFEKRAYSGHIPNPMTEKCFFVDANGVSRQVLLTSFSATVSNPYDFPTISVEGMVEEMPVASGPMSQFTTLELLKEVKDRVTPKEKI